MNDEQKTKAAIDAVKKLMKEMDLGGSFCVVSRTGAEILHVVDPTWTAITIPPEGGLKVKTTHLEKSEDKLELLEGTSHLLAHLRAVSRFNSEQFESIIKGFEKVAGCEVEETGAEFFPHIVH